MRIEIDTDKKPLTDKDIRALYMMVYGLDNSTPRMRFYNLQYIADRYGFKLVKKTPLSLCERLLNGIVVSCTTKKL